MLKKFDSAKQKYASQLAKGLKQTSKQMARVLPKDRRADSGGNAVSADVAASALKLLADLAQPLRLGKTNLHPYRLKVKELRSVLQMAANSDQQKFVQSLGEVKDAIGEWHDWEELVAIGRKLLDHGTNCQLLQQLRTIGDAKYRNALALSENMRKKFLRMSDGRSKFSSRRRVHGSAEPIPAEPVWRATAALIA